MAQHFEHGLEPMQQYSDTFIKGTEYEERFNSLAERERLLGNLTALRRTLWELRANVCQLERLLEEARVIRSEAIDLREQISCVTERLRRDRWW